MIVAAAAQALSSNGLGRLSSAGVMPCTSTDYAALGLANFPVLAPLVTLFSIWCAICTIGSDTSPFSWIVNALEMVSAQITTWATDIERLQTHLERFVEGTLPVMNTEIDLA